MRIIKKAAVAASLLMGSAEVGSTTTDAPNTKVPSMTSDIPLNVSSGGSSASTTLPVTTTAATTAVVTTTAANATEDGLDAADKATLSTESLALLLAGASFFTGGTAVAVQKCRERRYEKAHDREKQDELVKTFCTVMRVDSRRSLTAIDLLADFLQLLDQQLMATTSRPDLHLADLDQNLLGKIIKLHRTAIEAFLRKPGFFVSHGSSLNMITGKTINSEAMQVMVLHVTSCLAQNGLLERLVHAYHQALAKELSEDGLVVNDAVIQRVHPRASVVAKASSGGKGCQIRRRRVSTSQVTLVGRDGSKSPTASSGASKGNQSQQPGSSRFGNIV